LAGLLLRIARFDNRLAIRNETMKMFFARLVIICTATVCAVQSHAVTVSVAPSAISNTYNGVVTLQVTGLTNGETVVVQKFLDANGNGSVDTGETLCQGFKLTDGHAHVFQDGATAVTNLSVPGDTDAIAGQITAALNISQSGFEQIIAGKYLYVVTSPSGNFTPQTNSFTVTNFPYAQAISGNVIANTTNVPNAEVLIFVSTGQDLNPQGGAVADSSGHYQISAPPGDYVLAAFKSNFVANVGVASVTLTAGVNLSTNLFLISADRTISGSFVDASNLVVGLPGVLVPLESQNGLLTVAFTDTNGNFNAGVTSDNWKVEVPDQAAAFHDYLRPQNKVHVDTTSGSVSGVTIALPKANAIFYGTVKDGSNQPMANISLFSSDNNNGFEQSVATDANGKYFAGAFGSGSSSWQIQVSSDGNPPNYIFSSPPFDFNQNGGTNLNPGQALLYNFIALVATNHITGHVQDHNNNALTNVQVVASATIGGANFQTQTDTDGSGNYSLNVANGTWTVSVSCQGGNDSLDNILGQGTYMCPGTQNVGVTNNNGAANFTVQPCAGIQVLTPSPLASGQVGVYYSNALSAVSCAGNFTWTVNSGTLPPGLALYSPGALNGTPTNSGTFNFTVHVTDGSSAATNQNYSLTINSPVPPTVGQPTKSGTNFQFAVSGFAGQNYTIQTSTNLKSANWTSILVTNPPVNTFLFSDPNATNPARYYRVLPGP
jgi:putative Ig domain-containing protein/carboxypeptidase family protein